MSIDIDKIIINLNIIGNLKGGQRLSVQNDYFEIERSIFQFVYRRLYNESRENTVSEINRLVNTLETHINHLINENDNNAPNDEIIHRKNELIDAINNSIPDFYGMVVAS